MTTLTIELAPDVYELLRAEARQRGKAEHEIIELFLVERLTGETSMTPSPRVTPAPEVQALLTQITESDMIVPPHGTAADAVRLLESWNAADGADEDEEGEGTWEDVLRAIDTNRAAYRKLFADRDTQP
jgi:hypothetical protein